MNEVSKCAEINCLSFDNLYFPLENVNIEIWVLKATVQKLKLSSIVLTIVNRGVSNILGTTSHLKLF